MKATFKLKETPEQIALVQAIGSKNSQVSMDAMQALASFLGPVIQRVLMTKGTVAGIYEDAPYNSDDSPSYPLDLYYGEVDNYVTVWSQHAAGGLPSSQVTGNQEMKFMTYTLDSAIHWNKRYARKSRLDIISKAIQRMVNEVLVKQERNGWAVVLKALAEASTTPANSTALKHVLRANTADSFVLNDLNDLMVRHVRLNESYSGNSPDDVYSEGPTDLYVSPEIVGQIRAFAFNPMNTKAGVLSGTSGEGYTSSVVPLPENMREEIYRNAGMSNIFGVNITQLVELGLGKKYNKLFDNFAAATQYDKLDGSGDAVFTESSEEILIAIDNSREAFIRPVARDAENGGTFAVQPDDQWNLNRLDKAGFWGNMEEGRVCLDGRAVSGIIV
jgi:hypothetical protein|tara:strand:+ start:2929 stop:4092 length:1164 start_codon:yes stop_codon:yes gene_type:complete